MASTDLTSLIQSLPTELYDEIYHLTFSADSIEASALGDKLITKSYKPPSLLHVNRYTRETFSKLFYGNKSVFYCRTKEVVVKWLASLPTHHIDMIQRIRVHNYLKQLTSPRWNRARLDLYSLALSQFSKAVRLTKNPIRLIDQVFEFDISPKSAETPKWTGLRRHS